MPISQTTKNNYYRQVSPPSNPSFGDSWDELDSNNNLIEKWYWDGAWASSIKDWSWFLSGASGTSTGLPVGNDYLYKLLRWEYTIISNNAWNSSNYVVVHLGRANGATNTTIQSVTYNNSSLGQIRKIKSELNLTFDFNSTVADRLYYLVQAFGSVSFNFSTLLKYQLIRR